VGILDPVPSGRSEMMTTTGAGNRSGSIGNHE
jgi:hypothetical protein